MSEEEIQQIRDEAFAEAFYMVGHHLKYEYEGLYDCSSIEEFFDKKGDEIMEKYTK